MVCSLDDWARSQVEITLGYPVVPLVKINPQISVEVSPFLTDLSGADEGKFRSSEVMSIP